MTATAHALVGGAIAASSVSHPILGISLATLSHPLIDLIPHWDAGVGWRQKSKLKLFVESVIDLGLGIVLSYFLFGQNIDWRYFFVCILASEAWDLAQTPYWFLKWDFPPFSWVYAAGHKMQGRIGLPWGIVTQVATVAGVVVALQSFH